MHHHLEHTPESFIPGAQVALAELQRLCVGQHEDALGLQEALATAQPASAAENKQRLAEHLAGPAITPGVCVQHTDQPTPGSPAALHPGPRPLQLPALQQALWTGAAPPPGEAATNQATQEESTGAPLTVSAALAAIDRMAGNEAAGPAKKGSTPGYAGLPAQPAARARKEGPHKQKLSQPSTMVEHSSAAAAMAPGLWCHEALASQGTGSAKHRPGKGKSRPPCAPDILSRQAAGAGGRVCARKQRRPQAAREATSTAGSSGGAAVAGAAAPGAGGGTGMGKGKSRPPMTGSCPPKQQGAAMGAQLSRKRLRKVNPDQADAEETTSADAARARLQSWVRQGLPSLVSRPPAAAQTATAVRAPAAKAAAPAAPDKAAAGKSKHRIRQPYAEALLAIPRQLAANNKRDIQASSPAIIPLSLLLSMHYLHIPAPSHPCSDA